MAENIRLFNRVEGFAREANDRSPIVERTVDVPPWNRSEDSTPGRNVGWVGFNMTLPNSTLGKPGYEAYGIVLTNDPNKSPTVVMRIVNATPDIGGFDLLTFDQFSELAWNASRVYAAATLQPTQPSFQFQFFNLDNATKYAVFFRGLDNGTDDSQILITIKEAWLEGWVLIPATPLDSAMVAAIVVVGASLTIVGYRRTLKKRPRRRSITHTQEVQSTHFPEGRKDRKIFPESWH
jgi:hypothetical protein